MRGIAVRTGAINNKRIFEWARLLSVTGIAQITVQGIGLVSGILIIRLLPTQEYALYTLANTMLGTMTVLADGGIANGMMVEGGKVWKDREKLGVVISTGLDLRRKFAFFSLLIAAPILFYLLHHHGASLLFNVLIILSLVVAFIAALSDSLLEIPVKLNQEVNRLQKNQVFTSITRFILITSSIFFFPITFIAILGNGIPRLWGNIRLKKITAEYADPKQLPDKEVRKRVLKSVERILPGSIYYCISGQITIWLISIFGNTTSIAQIGALSRLTLLLNIISTLISTLIEPRFARLANNRALIKKRFFQILSIITAFCVITVALVWLFPSQVLFILGKAYNSLSTEILLMTIGACLSLIASSIYRLMACRGIIPKPLFFFICIFITQILCLVLLDMTKINNVLLFAIYPPIVGTIYRIAYFLYTIKRR